MQSMLKHWTCSAAAAACMPRRDFSQHTAARSITTILIADSTQNVMHALSIADCTRDMLYASGGSCRDTSYKMHLARTAASTMCCHKVRAQRAA
jgi:hypothetical protein